MFFLKQDGILLRTIYSILSKCNNYLRLKMHTIFVHFCPMPHYINLMIFFLLYDFLSSFFFIFFVAELLAIHTTVLKI